MNFGITKEVEFDAGHRVPNHKSKCKNPHGHRYRVVVHLEGVLGTEGSEEGMVSDFGDVKAILMERVHYRFDHGFIVYENDDQLRDALDGFDWKVFVFPYVPTAENIARWIFDDLQNIFDRGVLLRKVEVWETPTSKAVYPL